jgi:arginase
MSHRAVIILAPFSGGGRSVGPADGPGVLMKLGLAEHVSRFCDVSLLNASEIFTATWPNRPMHPGRIIGGEEVEHVARLLGALVFSAHRTSRIPVVVGGDHSVSLGTVTQVCDRDLYPGCRTGLIWIDAHYDSHTVRTTHSRYANGLPMAAALGAGNLRYAQRRKSSRGWHRLVYDPKDVIHIGAGKIDCEPEEVALLHRLGVHCVTHDDIFTHGIAYLGSSLREFVGKYEKLVVSMDLDVIDKAFAPGVSFQNAHGLHPVHLELISRIVRTHGGLTQLEIMEYNPLNDVEHKTGLLVLSLLEAFMS